MLNRTIDRNAAATALAATGLAMAVGLGADAWAESPATATPMAPAATVTVLHCGHLLDSVGGKLLGATTIVVEGKRVREVTSGTTTAPGAVEIELGDQTCLPGLIDSHTHLTEQTSPSQYVDQFRWNIADYAVRSTIYARRTLLAGFTTVRNVGDRENESVALRNAINAGLLPGPRIFTAGVPIGSTGGHADPTDGYRADLAGDPGPKIGIINSPDEAVKAVREHYKMSDDLIKIMPSGGVLDESASGDNSQLTLE
jgi:imidazolonepropionase-like amidohydrolase